MEVGQLFNRKSLILVGILATWLVVMVVYLQVWVLGASPSRVAVASAGFASRLENHKVYTALGWRTLPAERMGLEGDEQRRLETAVGATLIHGTNLGSSLPQ